MASISSGSFLEPALDNMTRDGSTSPYPNRIIVVANMLPLHAQKVSESSEWHFTLDEDSLLLQMKDGFHPETEVLYVGSLKAEVSPDEQDIVAQTLLDEFKCVPTFLPPEIHEKYYHGFCKQYLWPLFHYMLPMCLDHGDRFDRQLWQAYVSANKIFADKITEVLNLDEDFVWVHDYHLMVLPTFLRKRYNRVRVGFFLHSPFPSSEIYRTLPVRDEILKGLLNSDLIGFHTFDYARHFLSSCGRMLGLDYKSKRGHIGLDYFGRTVYVKILPVGIHMGRMEAVLNLPSTLEKMEEIRKRFEGKTVILGVDDMDIFKGISLKMLAFERLLRENPVFQGKVVLVQIVNPARSSGKDVREAQHETYATVKKINETFGISPAGYEPVVLLERYSPSYEKTAYYSLAACCIVNAVRDGMNLVPYKYIASRQGSSVFENSGQPPTSVLVVSEFIGCSPSLSGAIRVNPWDIESVAEALCSALVMNEAEKRIRHEKHFRFVSSHDVAYWARSFMWDMERVCREQQGKQCWGIGFGLRFRVVSLSPGFGKLSAGRAGLVYEKARRRVIFLDYDGTVVSQSSMVRSPDPEAVHVLVDLCSDPRNAVFIVSGRGRDSLSEWLAPCGELGLAAEHGYFIRWNKSSEWESLDSNLDWKEIVEPIMEQYTEATDGSSIEVKDSALVWHHQDSDPDFGSCQANELLLHLESVLVNEPAFVWRGQHIVEVKPQGVTKGLVAEKVLRKMVENGGHPDFILCIGDDHSDEDMFESILKTVSGSNLPNPPEIFTCTVGQKPSKAKYYLDDTADVLQLLRVLADSDDPKSSSQLADFQVGFEEGVL
ncbi:Probable alpha-alpha-trehalose-phosphate synthase [Striga hermonthica]|uniref:alpha,alpha-trehalose-phosphate synthase (UDP-forming) n=1 Tax=Striga hermonthica TaxID=68872 RepID=A0A9N7MTE0_STRHE|nr:Probable alpha-alpha-trehalose-phosphate synthase [Striga hermonthica]